MLSRTSPISANLGLIIVLVLGHSSSTSAVDTSKLDPPTMNDTHGNSADENSLISYRDIAHPPSESAQCTGCVGDGGIRPFLDGAKNFAHMVSPDYPYEMIEKIADNRISEITDDYQKTLTDNIGLVICVAIGFLFILIFPIVGCCYCCCRCCGKCGGSRKTDGRPREGCYRPCLIVTQLVLSIFVLVGGVMLLATSDSITDGLASVRDDVPANLDALKKFLNDSTEVIDEFATTDLNFTRDVIFRDLDNIGFIFGGMVRDNFLNETNVYLDVISKSVKRMDKDMATLKEQIPGVNEQLDYVKSNVSAYIKVMEKIKTDFDTQAATTGSSQTAPNIDSTIDTTEMNTFNGTSQIDEVGNLTEKYENSMKEINDIPEKVHNDSGKAVSDLKTSILDYTSDVTDTTDDLDFADRIETDDMKDDIVDYADTMTDYDDYRQYASQGLGAVVIVIALLLLLGLFFGTFCGKSSTPPHERGCASNSGGNLLIAAVVLTFIFGSLLMLLTTLLFIVGTPLENYGCVAFRDLSVLDKLINDYHVFGTVDGTGNYLGEKILDDANQSMTLQETMASCKNNEGIYKAFRMNESNIFNITEILDYKSKFSVKDDISTVNVDFSTIKILTPELKDDLKELNDSIQYNFTTYTSQLERNATKEAVDFKATLEKDKSSQTTALQAVYTTTIASLQTALDTEGKTLQDSMDILKSQINDLSNTLNPSSEPSMSDEIGNVQTAMEGLDNNLDKAGNSSFENGLESYTNRIFGVVDAYINRLLHALDYDIGRCRPVWDIYNYIFVDNICDTLIASMNGFWFAIGWSLAFLMPSIVIATKLASLFRTMTLDDLYETSYTEPYDDEVTKNGKGPHGNKVGPMEMVSQDKKW